MKILVSAYACEPHRGSEPGVGWAWVELMSTFAEVTVLTRSNNRTAIEKAAADHAWVGSVRWVYHDLPGWAMTLKRSTGLVQPYYAAWQHTARRILGSLVDEQRPDLVHHLTFGTYWMPFATDRLKLPVVIGPVGGAEAPPVSFVVDDFGAFAFEASRFIARAVLERLPLTRRPVSNSALCIAKARETARRLTHMGAHEVIVRSEVVMPDSMQSQPAAHGSHAELVIVSVCRLVHLKGIQLALRAIASVRNDMPEFRYVLVGDGPYRRKLEKLVSDLNLADIVSFVGEVTRERALEYLADADLFLHPSLHDSGGWACIEAMWSGVPVICLDIGGPANQVVAATGRKVELTTPDQTVLDLGASILDLALDSHSRASMSLAAKSRVGDQYSRDAQRDWLVGAYSKALNHGDTP